MPAIAEMAQSDISTTPMGSSIPKTVHENLQFRVIMRQQCDPSPYHQRVAWELCRRDIVAFFDMFLFTYDPRKTPHDRPFILWDYQEEYVRKIYARIHEEKDLLTEKSRDMGVTWCILGVYFYRWLFKDENFLVGSRTEDEVDTIGNMKTHFERLRYFLKTVPAWLLRIGGFDPKNSGYMKIWKSGGASIVGESMNENFSRQGRFNAVLLDEFAFVEKAERIWRATGDSTPCRMPVSTPKGKHNQFGILRHGGKIEVETLHWTKHPEKDDAWYQREKERRTDTDVAQELDIAYVASAGKPFYGGFQKVRHVRKLQAVKHKPLFLGWDYGYHHPACLISCLDTKGRWLLLAAIMGEDTLLRAFARDIVVPYLNMNYTGYQYRSYGDPAGKQKSDKSEKTSEQILGEAGFGNIISKPSNYAQRKEIIEGKLNLTIDGLPALLVNDTDCDIVIEGFEGGYHYPESPTSGKATLETPFHDDYYSHIMNGIEYIAVNLFQVVKQTQNDNTYIPYNERFRHE